MNIKKEKLKETGKGKTERGQKTEIVFCFEACLPISFLPCFQKGYFPLIA